MSTPISDLELPPSFDVWIDGDLYTYFPAIYRKDLHKEDFWERNDDWSILPYVSRSKFTLTTDHRHYPIRGGHDDQIFYCMYRPKPLTEPERNEIYERIRRDLQAYAGRAT